ncbi:MAG: exopolyphosphatase [Pedobacter sp.]|nr:MAG: exopolyphosphatase [Pedobacter sp.]
MKVAIIDLGTNTFHLLIAEVNLDEKKVLYKTNKPVRLGEDITLANRIIDRAFERGVTCLKEFKETMNQHGVGQVKAVATSGVRSAINGQNFVDAVKEHTGIVIDVIDGNEEANYIYKGVKWSGAISNPSLIMDIGGGSTEFILCDPHQLLWKKSYNVGAARLMQMFFKSDPISQVDELNIVEHLDSQLADLLEACKIHRPEVLIGSAGAFETFELMINNRMSDPTATIDYAEYRKLATTLKNSNHNDRTNMNGLIPLRVDMIVMAAILTDYVLDKLEIKKIKLSTFDLKMGVLSSL